MQTSFSSLLLYNILDSSRPFRSIDFPSSRLYYITHRSPPLFTFSPRGQTSFTAPIGRFLSFFFSFLFFSSFRLDGWKPSIRFSPGETDSLSLSFYLSARLYDQPLARFQDFLPSNRNEETDSPGPIKRGPFFPFFGRQSSAINFVFEGKRLLCVSVRPSTSLVCVCVFPSHWWPFPKREMVDCVRSDWQLSAQYDITPWMFLALCSS